MNRLPFTTNPPKLAPADVEHAAELLGVEPAAIRAVIAVEAAGGGFQPDGRPKVLFEAHRFSKLTRGLYDASHPDISSKVWRRDLYKGGSAEWGRIERAARLNRPAALMAASWGMFQIMGENHRRTGYATVESFAAAMCQGEAEHLAAFLGFCKSSGLVDELRDRRWADFARIYNGPSFAKNSYDVRLAEAYQRFAPAKTRTVSFTTTAKA